MTAKRPRCPVTYTLHHGDCLEVMAGMEAGSVDAVVTDPPYCSGGFSESQKSASDGSGLRSETRKALGWFVADNMGTSGFCYLMRSVAAASIGVVAARGGHLLMFSDWRMIPLLVPAVEAAGWRYKNLVVWDKGSPALGWGFRTQHELVCHFTVGKPEAHDHSTGNVISIGRQPSSGREHQTQKPVPLMRRLLRVVSGDGATILDPFTGSGTTGVACIEEGRHFIGIEREAEYVEISRRRIDAAAAQLRMDVEA